ncbi:hypothetical protein DLJ53_09890 [Acuticoccus sediminis]|uniref:Dyp-type peroxidase C-terminal domain-containing protein n=1 Tax=Acuticoccus sediminis TaxID=2184697 RepID=A0A8B2NWG6_9HYPH|nr:Dyp-type peroxidase domain-containing protein [Acuticoccus sediminis]RAI01712.1 hypothetical protein DLJ53_09890 [Acuticoccus sediminis]
MPYVPPRHPKSDRVQTGVHFRPGETPPDLWRLIVLDVVPGAAASDVADALGEIWQLLTELSQGRVRELGPYGDGSAGAFVPDGSLAFVLGYGARLFGPRAGGAPLIDAAARPGALPAHYPAGNMAPFPALHWRDDAAAGRAQRDIAVQLTADTELALARAVLDIAELIRTASLPLRLRAMFDGFGRDDRRSWIGFHDAINTLSAADRREAIIIERNAASGWTEGGTYMVFLRVVVDIGRWRDLDVPAQEAVVGRTKLHGVPLAGIDRTRDGRIETTPDLACPFRTTGPDGRRDPEACREPDFAHDPRLAASHVGRASPHWSRARIYRQGYEFLEVGTDGRPVVGLNFVAFVKSPDEVHRLLAEKDGFGDCNFGGGVDGIPSPPLLSLSAAGVYVAPAIPDEGERFPGECLFMTETVA